MLHLKNKNILVMTAVDAERQAVLRGLKENTSITVTVAGVGPAEAAANTAIALSKGHYDLVISMGIAGGFVNKAPVGSVVIADQIIHADLGAESSEGFLPVEQLGFGTSKVTVDEQLMKNMLLALEKLEASVRIGSILTLSTVTGTKQTADVLQQRYPHAVAEAMEGFGVAIAAEQFGLPCMEIRAISNPIGPRDREAWKIKEAFAILEKSSEMIQEVF
ncbi:futalosine hydrolase [Evansella cellulosilytica]|uniref:Futalosine hydrolase n=1 Tax=Evansella cellulosilytica (strain ATCC 21833 / DSM 2522 / FERM P-1141 / JCM 9156 / N-4) TaxID=649639 RepID=E6U0T2_EVAC2|nr:futalosine hydrolase [Evansella cellulosilytica]ADU29130.1 futalosine nucleosidase [Evansella cellulosilytica DSM 2522]